MDNDTKPRPDRAPGIQQHGARWVVRVALDTPRAEQLADEWERTGERPADQARRLVGEGLASIEPGGGGR